MLCSACNSKPDPFSTPPLLHDILGLPNAYPTPANIRDARERVLKEISNGNTLGEYDYTGMICNSEVCMVSMAAGMLLGGFPSERQSRGFTKAGQAYRREVLSRLPGNIFSRFAHSTLEYLRLYKPALRSPWSNQQILDTVCRGHGHIHDTL